MQPTSQQSSANPMPITVLSVLFLVAGLFTLFLWGIPSIQQSYASSHWPKTAGIITVSKADNGTTTNSNGQNTENVYGADIAYQYTVNKTSYTGGTVALGKNVKEFYDEASAKAVLDQYPAGKNVDVFYDPAHPQTAVLETGTGADSFVAAGLGILFLILGVILFVVGSKMKKAKA